MKTRALILLVLIAFASVYTQAQALIQVDEFGNGTFNGQPMQGVIGTDPSQPGVQALIYHLPQPVVQPGDVILLENSPTVISDVIRFMTDPQIPHNGLLIFYSDNSDGVDEPADISGLPAFSFPVQVSLQEGTDGTLYSPGSSDPGFLDNGVTYDFISDAPEVPEGGATVLLLSLSLLGLWGAKRFNRSH